MSLLLRHLRHAPCQSASTLRSVPLLRLNSSTPSDSDPPSSDPPSSSPPADQPTSKSTSKSTSKPASEHTSAPKSSPKSSPFPFPSLSSSRSSPPTTTATTGTSTGASTTTPSPSPKFPTSSSPPSGLSDFSLLNQLLTSSSPASSSSAPSLDFTPRTSSPLDLTSLTSAPQTSEIYHLHVYAHKHNTHVTFTRPDKSPIISLSAGNIGFRKAQRGTYDAAFQLAAHVFRALEDMGVRPKEIELIERGFGQGREAVSKALMGVEGRFLNNQVVRVTDGTRLKFGGTRSPKPRRLG